MRVAFRTDASLMIGSGHVMRCLTLANALRAQGAECLFLSREHTGHLHAAVEAHGFPLFNLGPVDARYSAVDETDYSRWLGVDVQRDVDDTLTRLTEAPVDWLVVDHYSLDRQWEQVMTPVYKRLLVIDDLANREHIADVLLDQNLSNTAAHYQSLVPNSCTLMMGPRYALLRPEFASLRPESLVRRSKGTTQNVLVTMGGVDRDNVTSTVLDALRDCVRYVNLKVTVVMGANAPWCKQIIAQATTMPYPIEVLVNSQHMAQLMCEADIAIGAAGSTSWERCCMGLPTLQWVLADNQRMTAQALSALGAAYLVEPIKLVEYLCRVFTYWKENPTCLIEMSRAAAQVTDGAGTSRVVHQLLERGALCDDIDGLSLPYITG